MMTEETDVLSEADQISALLPWYVTGKISAADRAKVDAFAVRHPEVRRHLALAQDEADVTFAVNQEIGPPKAALDKLKASLAASPSVRLKAAQASLLDRLGTWLGGFSPRQLAYAGVAAALAIAVQATSIGSLMLDRAGTGHYRTAAGSRTDLGSGTFAMVAFQPAAPAGTLSAFLSENKFLITDGPKAGGMFVVRVSEQVLSADAAAAALAKLKARSDLVSFASAAPAKP